MEMKKKDAATAILLNLVIPGVGYIYAGRATLGVLVLILAVGPVFFIGPLAFGWVGFFSIIGAIDGYLTVKKHNTIVEEAAVKLADAELRRCPMCGEKIQRVAKVCRFCGKDVVPE